MARHYLVKREGRGAMRNTSCTRPPNIYIYLHVYPKFRPLSTKAYRSSRVLARRERVSPRYRKRESTPGSTRRSTPLSVSTGACSTRRCGRMGYRNACFSERQRQKEKEGWGRAEGEKQKRTEIGCSVGYSILLDYYVANGFLSFRK